MKLEENNDYGDYFKEGVYYVIKNTYEDFLEIGYNTRALYKGDGRGEGFWGGNWLSNVSMSDTDLWTEDKDQSLFEEHVLSYKTQLSTKTDVVRTFDTGANRDTVEGKLDYEGFLSPTVLKRYAEYMHKNRTLQDGSIRDSDNWQKGIPVDVYMKSMYRHFFDVWSNHRGLKTEEDIITNLCALTFNVMGMLHEKLKEEINE